MRALPADRTKCPPPLHTMPPPLPHVLPSYSFMPPLPLAHSPSRPHSPLALSPPQHPTLPAPTPSRPRSSTPPTHAPSPAPPSSPAGHDHQREASVVAAPSRERRTRDPQPPATINKQRQHAHTDDTYARTSNCTCDEKAISNAAQAEGTPRIRSSGGRWLDTKQQARQKKHGGRRQ